MQQKKLFSICTLAVALSACSMAPTYHRPDVALAPAFQHTSDSENPQGHVAAADLGWRDYFADERLRRLIELALQNNHDLRVAALNVESVRAQYAIARADRLPALGATGTASKARVAQDLGSAGKSYISQSYTVGLGVTSFELDLFGRLKSLSDAALNNYFAEQQTRDATQISLIASVAKAYFTERIAQAQMDLSAKVLQTREQSKKLTDLEFKAGVISRVDVETAITEIETARADYAAAEQTRDQARNALVLLIGQPLPEDLPAPAPLDKQFVQAELPVGLPSDILYQRPDVRAAEYALKAENANIGAARAAFFPQISLTGSIGTGSTELSNLFTGVNHTWSFVPQITLPIFTWGQNKANLDVAKINKNIAVEQYQQTVQAAFGDVADALAARSSLLRQYRSQQTIVQSQANYYKLVQLRFKHGIASSLERLEAERSNYSAQQTLLTTQLTLLENRADLYKVLGGGLHADTVHQAQQEKAQ